MFLIKICLKIFGQLKLRLPISNNRFASIDLEDDTAVCCFLKAAYKLVMVSKWLGCFVVSSKVKRGPTTSPKTSTTVTYYSSSDSNTSGSSQGSNPATGPEHRFRVVQKEYKSGKKLGKKHETVSLLITPFEFKRRTDRSKCTGGLVYFSCNGCQNKHGFYNKAVARKIGDEYELVSWPLEHKCCPSAIQHLIVDFRRSLYESITKAYKDSTRPTEQSLPKLYEDLRHEFANSIKEQDNKDLFYNLVPKFRNLQKGLYAHRSQYLPTTPRSHVSVLFAYG